MSIPVNDQSTTQFIVFQRNSSTKVDLLGNCFDGIDVESSFFGVQELNF